MSNALYCRFIVQPISKPSYWWPLVIEALRRASFVYGSSRTPAGIGRFVTPQSLEEAIPPDGDINIVGPFRTLWDEAYRDTEDILAHFVFARESPFDIEGQVGLDPETGQRNLWLILPIESLEPAIEQISHCIHRWLDAVTALYEGCGLGEAEIWWQKDEWVIGAIGKRVEPLVLSHHRLAGDATGPLQHCEAIEVPLSDGAWLSLLDPFPVPLGAKWFFVSLSQGEPRNAQIAPGDAMLE